MPLVASEFVSGFRLQTEWATLIAAAFFFGKIGAGLFLMSLFTGSWLGALLGLLIVLIGKGGAHLLYLGRPERFWRGLTKPGTSWVARGFWAMLIMMVAGAIFLALPPGSAGWWIAEVIAGISAFIVAIYDGFLLNASPSIPLWNTAMMPVLCLFYSLLGGTSLTLFLINFGLATVRIQEAFLSHMEIVLLITNLIAVGLYLISMTHATAAARKSLQLLVGGTYAVPFYGLAIGVGLVFTLLMAYFVGVAGGPGVVGLITAADLVGHYFIFFLLLRVGVYKPVLGQLTI
ncbi:polysulfide reductase, NrfD [Peptococcaceae bacterium CEB3]|nr:polysulfide reductase, NrfD [Peptococcaceae bacterium CEB3]